MGYSFPVSDAVHRSAGAIAGGIFVAAETTGIDPGHMISEPAALYGRRVRGPELLRLADERKRWEDDPMDDATRKTILHMIPYGIYVLTAKSPDGEISAATVNWVTQTSFAPPLIAVAVKADSGAYAALKAGGHFALNMLGKGQQGAAFAFFKPAEVADGRISGEAYRDGSTGTPILESAPGAVEFRVAEIVERGDHHIVIGEAVDAHASSEIEGRPDDASLHMRELGDNVFYGG
jgi:flavin reductase (DIM6/NTAB) family NADH-FMN oxidoreductase RutF